MDVLEFIKERDRMCRSCGCDECPARGIKSCTSIRSIDENFVEIVERWAKNHPAKTRQSQFLEQFPKAQLDENDSVFVCPAVLDENHRSVYGGCNRIKGDCSACRREFWDQEVE